MVTMTATQILARLQVPLTCTECGQSFTAGTSTARFCSRACNRINYNRENQDKIRAAAAAGARARRARQRAAEPPREKKKPPPAKRCEPGCQCGRHPHVIRSRRELTCVECGKPFTAKRSDARYCSRACHYAQYAPANKDKINAGHRRWNEAHPEAVAESKRRNEEMHGDRYRGAKRERYETGRADPDERAARQERNRAYYEENADSLRAYARERSRTKRAIDPLYGRKATHGTELGPLFESLWEAQDGKCYLCREPLKRNVKRAIHLDHDHSCCGPERTCEKCRRGLSCKECNLAIGWAGDDPDKLRRIADNLEKAIAVTNGRLF